MEMKRKELQVAALSEGTVIDHIPSEMVFKVISLLGLENLENPVTIGNNLESKKMGRKGIIKISGKFFHEDEISRIALIAPHVVLNIIRNYEVVEKKKLEIPPVIKGFVRCNNPKCITNNEPMISLFDVTDKNKGDLRCHYCNLKIGHKDIMLK